MALSDQAAEVYLAHFGVKGMKWGVIRNQTKASNQNLKEQAKKYAEGSRDSFGPISNKTYAQLSTKDSSLKRGQNITRVTTRKNEQLRDLTYASFDPADVNTYRSLIPTGGKFSADKKYFAKSYEHVFEATRNLKGPSEKARVDAFSELMDNPAVLMKNGERITGKEYLVRMGYTKEVRQTAATQLGLDLYKSVILDQREMDTPLGTAYYNNLRQKGYDYLADDNDRGLLSKDPIIVFNDKGVIKPKSVRELTREEVLAAQEKLQLPEVFGVQKEGGE